jgi:hypothetical protein
MAAKEESPHTPCHDDATLHPLDLIRDAHVYLSSFAPTLGGRAGTVALGSAAGATDAAVVGATATGPLAIGFGVALARAAAFDVSCTASALGSIEGARAALVAGVKSSGRVAPDGSGAEGRDESAAAVALGGATGAAAAAGSDVGGGGATSAAGAEGDGSRN